MPQYRAILDPTVPLSRKIFETPTQYYKAGVVLVAWLNGLQDHFVMVGGMQSARTALHYADVFRLADKARILTDPDRARASHFDPDGAPWHRLTTGRTTGARCLPGLTISRTWRSATIGATGAMTLTESHIVGFAGLSGDFFDLHMDDAFARNLGFPGPGRPRIARPVTARRSEEPGRGPHRRHRLAGLELGLQGAAVRRRPDRRPGQDRRARGHVEARPGLHAARHAADRQRCEQWHRRASLGC